MRETKAANSEFALKFEDIKITCIIIPLNKGEGTPILKLAMVKS